MFQTPLSGHRSVEVILTILLKFEVFFMVVDQTSLVLQGRFVSQPAFPTSDPNVVKSPDGSLKCFYRGFDGALYYVKQSFPGNSLKYEPLVRINSVFE
jgi:hypothetical protein